MWTWRWSRSVQSATWNGCAARASRPTRGVVCDGACRAFDRDGIVTGDIFVAGDVARWPHPLCDGELLAVEHWGNAVEQAQTAAHNMVCASRARRAHKPLPAFWSDQFGLNIKAVGLPTIAEAVVVTQGAVAERHFVAAYGRLAPEGREGKPAFIFLDPPDHDRLRRLVMHQFTPVRVAAMHGRIERLVDGLLDARRGAGTLDIVDDFAYPLPVTVICELLGVPREDEPRFHAWAAPLASSLDPAQGMTEEQVQHVAQAARGMGEYLGGLIAARAARPTDDLLSGLVADPDPVWRMDAAALLGTMILLLVAGHETTVNLITNGMLALLRHPDALEWLRGAPDLAIPLVEEVLRYDPPVQFRTRTTLADIAVAGVTIPRGATVALVLASGSRDPRFFPDADRFVPDRRGNAHLGFGGGIHYCVGAPLARREAQVALGALARRLVAPRLVADPSPYRDNASLRGPEHLPVAFQRLVD